MALVSAHRGGSGDDRSAENTLDAFEAAIALGCDFVEFDVRLTTDGTAVISHDPELTGDPLVTLDSVLSLVAGRIRAHVDLKVRGHDVELVERIVGALGVSDVIITTAEDSSVRRIRSWSDTHAPGLLVGLSSSPRSWDGNRWRRRLVQVEAAFPRTRVRLSRANLVVSHRTVARLTLRSYARRRGLPLVVWTVDDPADLRRWMNDPAVWVVTTNYPERALAAVRDDG